MMPKLKNYVYYAPAENGVYFRGWQGEFVLQGNNLYPVVAKVLSYFDGQHALSDIEAALPESFRPLLTSLTTQLQHYNMLVAEEVNPPSVSAADRQQFATTLAYFEERTDKPLHVFSQWRQQRVTVAGEGVAFTALIQHLLEAGVGNVSVYHTDSTHTQSAQATGDLLADLAGTASTNITVEEHASALGCNNRLIIITDGHIAAQGAQLLAKASPLDTPVLLAGSQADRFVITPLTTDCQKWADKLRTAVPSERTAVSRAQSLIGAAVVARTLRDAALTDFTDADERLHAVTAALTVTTHSLTGDATEQDENSALFDPVFGLMAKPDAADLPQLPLFVDATSVRPAYGTALLQPVTAWGMSIDEARHQMIERGLDIYCQSLSNNPATRSGQTPEEAIMRSAAAAQDADFAQSTASGWQPLSWNNGDHDEINQLLIAIRLFSGASPIVFVRYASSFVHCRVRVNNTTHYTFTHWNALHAVRAALGNAVMALQLPAFAEQVSDACGRQRVGAVGQPVTLRTLTDAPQYSAAQALQNLISQRVLPANVMDNVQSLPGVNGAWYVSVIAQADEQEARYEA